MGRCIACGRFAILGLREGNWCNSCYDKVLTNRLKKCIVCGESQDYGLNEGKWCDECYKPILVEKEEHDRHIKKWDEVRRKEGTIEEIRSRRYKRIRELIDAEKDAQAELLDKKGNKSFCLEMENTTFAVVDFETTGLKEIEGEIIEIGAVKVSAGKIIDEFDELSLPYMGLSLEAMDVNGITMNMVEDKPFMRDVFPKFMKFIGDCDYLVFHNAKFDVNFFLCEYMINFDPPYRNYDVADTLVLARDIWKTEVANHKLQTLAEYIGYKPQNTHRAIDDAKTCYAVLCAEADILKGDEKRRELRTKLRTYIKKHTECTISDIEHSLQEYDLRMINSVLDEFADSGNLLSKKNEDGYTVYSYIVEK